MRFNEHVFVRRVFNVRMFILTYLQKAKKKKTKLLALKEPTTLHVINVHEKLKNILKIKSRKGTHGPINALFNEPPKQQ